MLVAFLAQSEMAHAAGHALYSRQRSTETIYASLAALICEIEQVGPFKPCAGQLTSVAITSIAAAVQGCHLWQAWVTGRVCLQAPAQGIGRLLSGDGERLVGSLHASLQGKLQPVFAAGRALFSGGFFLAGCILTRPWQGTGMSPNIAFPSFTHRPSGVEIGLAMESTLSPALTLLCLHIQTIQTKRYLGHLQAQG